MAGRAEPHFVPRYGTPTWIDVWRSETGQVVHLHGDVEWGEELA